MTDTEIFEGLKEILAVMKPHLDTSSATLESNLVRDLGIDSLSMLLMSLALENKFKVNFDTTRAPFTRKHNKPEKAGTIDRKSAWNNFHALFFCRSEAALPDVYALRLGTEHRVAFVDVECIEEGLEVTY